MKSMHHMELRVDASVGVPYYRNTMSETTALRRAVDAATCTARELASSAGVSDRLLRMIRAGDRRLTPDVRDALARALRDRADRCREAAEALESVDAEPRS